MKFFLVLIENTLLYSILKLLSVPYKRIHPGVEDGTLNSEVLDKLEELAPKQKEEKDSDEEIDPRWNELKKLLNDNK